MVIISFPPDDLIMSIRLADGNVTDVIELRKEQRAWESYYRFIYDGRYPKLSLKDSTLIITSSEKSFEIPMPEAISGIYNGFVTLDYKNETITAG